LQMNEKQKNGSKKVSRNTLIAGGIAAFAVIAIILTVTSIFSVPDDKFMSKPPLEFENMLRAYASGEPVEGKIATGERKPVDVSNGSSAGNSSKEGSYKIESTPADFSPLPEKLNVASFEAELSRKGVVNSYRLTLCGFNSSNEYVGMYYFWYDHNKKEMTFTHSDAPIAMILFNENYEISGFFAQLKRLPLSKQVAKLNFDKYFVLFRSNTQIEKGRPIIDCSKDGTIPITSLKDYKSGQWGISDGTTGMYFSLYDGSSWIAENMIRYRMIPTNPETLGTTKGYIMKCDYRLTKQGLKVTRDYGETWIDVDISAEDLEYFYRNNSTIPEGSYYVSEDPGGIIAIMYGGKPLLRISHDDGATWKTIDFAVPGNSGIEDYGKAMIYRVIGFTSETDAYVALGSDWTPGSGETKVAFFTDDGWKSWTKKSLPLSGTSRTLSGMCFSDSKNGILSLENSNEFMVPVLFYTNDGGDTWNALEFSENLIPIRGLWFSKVDSLVFENGTYTMIVGQGPDTSMKMKFQSDRLDGNWSFVENYQAVVHTVG